MKKNVLVCGASFAGLSTAWWMNRRGYAVTVVEIGESLKKGGTPVNIEGHTIEIMRRMGLLEQILANRISMEAMEFKNSADFTEKSEVRTNSGQPGEAAYEIERDTLLTLLFDAVKEDVEFVYGDTLAALTQGIDGVEVVFRSGRRQSFELVFGCDGLHSSVRRLGFGDEADFTRFLQAYFSITIVNKSLIRPNTTQLYNEPGKAVLLNAYNGKTDIVLCFSSDDEIEYHHRNEEQQRSLILEQFAQVGWRTPELLDEVSKSRTFYFDKLCQIKMPSWTTGRIALIGDAGYCASPAAGKGGSLAIDGAAALADAFEKCHGNFELAFQQYDRSFRPLIDEVQANAVKFGVDMLLPRTEEAIRLRNGQTAPPDSVTAR